LTKVVKISKIDWKLFTEEKMDSNEKELSLTPIPGKSGKAYMGTYPDGGRVFVKMNTTPILAGLAKEQIAPQLLWSRRLPDGNVMSAQEWLNGEILTPNGMSKKQVVNILTRLHRSRPLMTQLKKLGYPVESPLELLNSWSNRLPIALRQNHYIQSVVKNLRKTVPAFREDYATIVHGDVRHSNWIETESGLIYLVDWDSVRLTDRMLDVAHILSHYIPDSNWRDWLGYYGYKYNQKVFDKLYWFGQYSFLCQIAKYYENNDLENVNREIYALRNFRLKYGKEI
jgi:phosphotransferase enzyme family protein